LNCIYLIFENNVPISNAMKDLFKSINYDESVRK
jgi:hypothetical protein